MGLAAFHYSDYNHYNGVMKMTATFCGHAQISQSADVEKWLYAVTLHLIEQGVNIFYLGGYGAFDSLAAAVLRKQKTQHPEIKNGFMSVFGVMTARATAALWQSISAGYGLKLLHIPTICMLKRFGGVDTNGSSKLPQALFISPKKPCSLCNCLCCTRSLSIRNDFFDLW